MIEMIPTRANSVSVFLDGRFMGSIVTVENKELSQMWTVPNMPGVEHVMECSTVEEGAALILMVMS
jgi:hypothetical protein